MINQTLGKIYNEPLVSVIVPAYNSGAYINKCICSLINQTYNNIEVIVVDDGSDDKTPIIVRSLTEIDSRIRYVRQNNSGVCIARNNGIVQAEGKYLLFVDADDYLRENYIAKLVYSAEKNQSELVIGGYSLVKDNYCVVKEVVPKSYKRYNDEMSAYCISSVCSRLYASKFWQDNNLSFLQEDGARGEDTPIAYYANLTAKNISIVNDSGYCYVQHPGSAMDGLRGFRKYHFPYNTFLIYLEKSMANRSENTNSLEYYQIGICKLFAQFAFLLARGAEKEQIRQLNDYIYKINDEYVKLSLNYSQMKIVIQSELPLTHKGAILLLSEGVRFRLLYFMMLLGCKRKGRNK